MSILDGPQRVAAVAAVTLLGLTGVTVPVAASLDVCGDHAAVPGPVVEDVPWQQTLLDPERVWPFSTGAGQTVAVVDSGVDRSHPQLAGRVLAGYDAVRGVTGGDVDCVSHGTAMASLVAATRAERVGFGGLAPGAKILPIRVGDTEPTATAVATAIQWAVTARASVILVSAAIPGDHAELRSAVAAAVRAGIVVVAPVGDRHDPGLAVDPPAYPAGYPDVIGVGSVDRTLRVVGTSQVGDDLDLVAPGAEVIAATRVHGMQAWSGTAVAAAIVAGAAALVRSAAPALTAEQVRMRLIATADPAPGGQNGPTYGHGLVNPYRAVTEWRFGGTPATIAGAAAPDIDPVATARTRWWDQITARALAVSAVLGTGIVLLVAGAVVLPRGRRRGWRPGRRPTVHPGQSTRTDADPFAVPRARGD